MRGYRDLISCSADPQPDAWVGLALALHRLPASPLAGVFADRLPVLFDVHACLGAARSAGSGGLARMTGLLAPGRSELDVAGARRAGHKPVPFQQFILKVHSRCNLACTYCYMYEMADQSWRKMPRRMSRRSPRRSPSASASMSSAPLPGVDVILHGGEPLLAGAEWLTELTGLSAPRCGRGEHHDPDQRHPAAPAMLKRSGISASASASAWTVTPRPPDATACTAAAVTATMRGRRPAPARLARVPRYLRRHPVRSTSATTRWPPTSHC